MDIAIIDCAIEGASHHCFNRLVQIFPKISFTYHDATKGDLTTLDKIKVDGIIILGSNSNVFEKLDWHLNLAKIAKKKLESGLPIMGICFGHQLIADLYGGSVEMRKSSVNKKEETTTSAREISLLEDFYCLKKGENIPVIVYHDYEVTKLPKVFKHLATSKDCVLDLVRHKKLLYLGIQGHPEASDYFIFHEEDTKLSQNEALKAQKGGTKIISSFFEMVTETL